MTRPAPAARLSPRQRFALHAATWRVLAEVDAHGWCEGCPGYLRAHVDYVLRAYDRHRAARKPSR